MPKVTWDLDMGKYLFGNIFYCAIVDFFEGHLQAEIWLVNTKLSSAATEKLKHLSPVLPNT